MIDAGYLDKRSLREAVEPAWGDELTLRHYHDHALSCGSPPVEYIRALMLDATIPGIDN